MAGKTSATRSACFQPDNYSDPRLFANRKSDREDLAATLDSYLAPGSPGEGRILVRGDRGVGKSILTRAALEEVIARYGPMKVVVDAGRTGHGADSFMRRLAADLAREVIENATDEELTKAANMMLRLAQATKVTVKDAKQWSRNLQIGATLKSKFLDSIQFEFGLTRATSRSASVEESYERAIDASFLCERLQDLLLDCRAARHFVVLFLDNLDQVGYGELKEDVERVNDLARYLLGLQGAVMVANLRSEFVSADLKKFYSIEKLVVGLKPEELAEIAHHRMSVADEERQKRLKQAGFETLIEQLSHWTDNAWSFLSWLAFFDYEEIDFTVADARALGGALLRFAARRFAGLSQSDLLGLGRVFRTDVHRLVTQTELDTHGVTKDLLDRAVRYGALVPDLLLNPDRYVLSSALHFLAVLPE